MSARLSISNELVQAIACADGTGRLAALRTIADGMSETTLPAPNSSPLCRNVIDTLHQQSLARIYEDLGNRRDGQSITEIDVTEYATQGSLGSVICALSRLTGLPAAMTEAAFAACSSDLLLVICRMQNFAWSSVRALSALRALPPNESQLEDICDEYHAIPVPVARRFGRFLRLHLSAAGKR